LSHGDLRLLLIRSKPRANVVSRARRLRHDERNTEDLLTVGQLADEYHLGRSTVWLHLRRHQVPRYRTPATGKTRRVRRDDWEQAMRTPIEVSRPKSEGPYAGE
jgi:hypothetical protein